jgi:UV DNA damage endonuclease
LFLIIIITGFEEALEIAISTWGDIKPVVHYSESRAEEKSDSKIRPHAHSDFVNGPIDDYGHDLDVMIEAKMKELALFGLKKNDAERLTAAA